MRRLLSLLLPILALLALGSTVQAQGYKITGLFMLHQFMDPVPAGSSCTYALTVARNTAPGSSGNFVALLSYTGLPAGVTIDPSSPSSITFGSKDTGTKAITVKVNVASTVPINTYHPVVTATRAGKDHQSYTWTLRVGTAPNLDPHANDDVASTIAPASVDIDVLANDRNNDGSVSSPTHPLTIISSTSSSNGGTTAIVNGKIRYTPPFLGTYTDPFQYTIRDDQGRTATALVTVGVGGAPILDIDKGSQTVSGCSGSATITATATGAGPFTFVWTGPAGSFSQVDTATTSTVTVTTAAEYQVIATDKFGTDTNKANATVTFDSTQVVTCPADITVCDDGSGSAAVTYPNPILCPGWTFTGYSPISGSRFSVGAHQVVGMVADAFGHTQTCTFNVIVNPTPVAATLTKAALSDANGPYAQVAGSPIDPRATLLEWQIADHSDASGNAYPMPSFTTIQTGGSTLDMHWSMFNTYDTTPLVETGVRVAGISYTRWTWSLDVQLIIHINGCQSISTPVTVIYQILVDPSGHGNKTIK